MSQLAPSRTGPFSIPPSPPGLFSPVVVGPPALYSDAGKFQKVAGFGSRLFLCPPKPFIFTQIRRPI